MIVIVFEFQIDEIKILENSPKWKCAKKGLRKKFIFLIYKHLT